MDATPAHSFNTHKNAVFKPISPGSPTFAACLRAPKKSPCSYQCIPAQPFVFLSCSTCPLFNSRPLVEAAPSPMCPGMVPGAGCLGFLVCVTSLAQRSPEPEVNAGPWGAAAAGRMTQRHDHCISEDGAWGNRPASRGDYAWSWPRSSGHKLSANTCSLMSSTP